MSIENVKQFIKNRPFIYSIANKIFKLLKKPIFPIIHVLYFPILYHYFSKKLHQIAERKQVFLIGRGDLGVIAMILHYAFLWSEKRNSVVIIDISPETNFVKKIAACVCPHLQLISYEDFFFTKIVLNFFKSEIHSNTLMKVHSIIYCERKNSISLLNTQNYRIKSQHTCYVGEYNKYFDPNREIISNKPLSFQKSYFRFMCSLPHEYEKFNDYTTLLYQSKPLKKTKNLKMDLNAVKQALNISDEFVILNINQKHYPYPVANRRRIYHPQRFNAVIDYFLNKGVSVVIQGRREQPHFKPRSNLINYAHSDYTSVENDLALFSEAQLVISSKTGPEIFAPFFHTPLLGVNYTEFPSIIQAIRYRYAFKKIRDPKTGKIVPWRDILTSSIFFDYGNMDSDSKLEYLEMTEEELLNAVEEVMPLLSRTEKEWLNYTDKQKKFMNQLDPTHFDLYQCKGAPCDCWLTSNS